MTTSEVLAHFSEANYKLTRDLLYFWERRGWVTPSRSARNVLGRRIYGPDQIRAISILLNGYADGLPPEAAHKMAELHDMLRGERVGKLLEANRQLSLHSLLEDRSAILRLIAQNVFKVMNCECCALLLFPKGSTDRLALAAYCGDKEIDGWSDRVFPLHETKHGGLTGFIAKRGLRVSLFGPEIRDHEYRSGCPPDHLLSGQCFSLLMVPLLDHKQQTIGWIKVENRKRPDGKSSEVAIFDSSDEAILDILSNQVVAMLENHAVMEASTQLLELMVQVTSVREFLRELLERAVGLVRADRGDVVWRDEAERHMRVQAKIGASVVCVDEVLPEKSLTRWVFNNSASRVVPDTDPAVEPLYHECCPGMRSEILVPLKHGSCCLGVLNLESTYPSFFDDRDLELLEHLAAHIVPAVRILAARVFR